MKNFSRLVVGVVILVVAFIGEWGSPSTSHAQRLAHHPLHANMQTDYTQLLTGRSGSNQASTASLVVEYKVGPSAVPDFQITPNIKILNNGDSDIPLSQLTLHYWFTRDSSPHMQAYCDVAQMGCANITETVRNLSLRPVGIAADSVIDIGFKSGVLAAHSDTGDMFFHAADSTSSSPIRQTNDFSYNGNITTYTPWPGITLYLNGQITWGYEPFCGGNLFPNCQTPASLRSALGLEPLTEHGFTGKGQTVVVIDSFGSPLLQQDLDTFSSTYGLPKANLQVIAPLGLPPFNPQDPEMAVWAVETTTDVENIHAMAPDAHIVVLASPVSETEGTVGLPEFLQLEQYAIDHHLGSIFSQSWDASELTLTDAAGQAMVKQYSDFYQQIATQDHVTVFSASGDHGATNAADLNGDLANVRTVGFPNDIPWVTSVGGVSLSKTQPASAWQGSGGGISRFFAEPNFQHKLPATAQSTLNDMRGVPDIAGDADGKTTMAIYFDGYWGMVGGTSVSTPQWAGMIAVGNQMAGRPLGWINPALYALGNSPGASWSFNDITTGNNDNAAAGVTGYPATPGWDAVTGWGLPRAAALLPALIIATRSE